jgi:hypothetical protein
MKTDFNEILKLLQASKVKKAKEGFTTSEFAVSIGKSDPHARRLLREMIASGIAAFAGKVMRPNMCGEVYPIPIYKLIPKK